MHLRSTTNSASDPGRASGGSPDPFADPDALIRRVFAYAAYRLNHVADAEDATSDAFERALRYRSSYDPARGTPAAWMLGIARRAVDDVFKRRIASQEEPPEQMQDEPDTALRLDLARALDRLDGRARELIALRYGADLTARQIGDVVGLGTNAVEVALHRALRTLRTELEPPGRDVRRAPLRAHLAP
jgi:RNA polymerase sigma-70 factor (ECF subfamily)